MDTARRAATVAIRALLVAAIALTVFVAYGLIDNAWYRVLAVRGGSMEPTIAAGDLIVITRPPADVDVGQVLTLQVDGAIVTHRVVEVAPDGTFVTQGDANDTRDDFTANDVHVVGEYRFSLPLVGALVDLFVSGAWATDLGAVGATIGSGTWADGIVAVSVDPATSRVTWAPTPAPTPTPSPPSPPPPPSPTASAETSDAPAPSATLEPSPTPAATPESAGESSPPSATEEPAASATPIPPAHPTASSSPAP